jgi:hypothetical protein
MRFSWIAQKGLDRPRKTTTFQMDDARGIKLRLKNTMSEYVVNQETVLLWVQTVQLWESLVVV